MTVDNDSSIRFSQIHKIVELIPNKIIRAQRSVSADEDFLRDHFPLFAVLPGVLMLEALYQASCWLIATSLNYECSVLVLAEAKNVKFADFVGPGETLDIECELLKHDDQRFVMKCQGTKGESTAVSARLVIEAKLSAYGGDENKNHDRYIATARRKQFNRMYNVTQE
jgi:3-hydroxyacyl-[acyl-carrier-protein] dehydratase